MARYSSGPGHTQHRWAFDRQAGERLRQHRRARGLTLQTTAAMLDISFQQLQKYETGDTSLTLWRAVHICEVLGFPLSELLYQSSRDPAPPEEAGRLPPEARPAPPRHAAPLQLRSSARALQIWIAGPDGNKVVGATEGQPSRSGGAPASGPWR